MGEAKQRGSFDERKAAAVKTNEQSKNKEQQKPKYKTSRTNILGVALAAMLATPPLLVTHPSQPKGSRRGKSKK